VAEVCAIELVPARSTGDERWAWLRRAMRDVGMPVSGWGRGFHSEGSHMRFTVGLRDRAPSGRDVAALVQDLWEQERPGYGLRVRVVYG
jgi:hypothetical protein